MPSQNADASPKSPTLPAITIDDVESEPTKPLNHNDNNDADTSNNKIDANKPLDHDDHEPGNEAKLPEALQVAPAVQTESM